MRPSHEDTGDRWLGSATDPSANNFIIGVVALICVFYVICTYQCLKLYILRKCCGRDLPVPLPDAVLLHEGVIVNLTGDQRRAALEAIFKESSKPATDLDVDQRHRHAKQHVERDSNDGYESDGSVPYDVDIPNLSTVGTGTSVESHHSDKTMPVVNHNLSRESQGSFGAIDELDSQSDDGSYESANSHVYTTLECDDASDVTPNEPYSESASIEENDAKMPSAKLSPKRKAALRQENRVGECSSAHLTVCTDDAPDFVVAEIIPVTADGKQTKCLQTGEENAPATKTSKSLEKSLLDPKPTRAPNFRGPAFAIPEDEVVDESKEDLVLRVDYDETDDQSETNVSSLLSPIALQRRESFSTIASEYTYDDDSINGDNVCPICLSGFKMGDVLLSSNHCSHVYCKECILEWLQNNEDCPVCRAGMVTESEMNYAANLLVGKTRMYRAVASYQSAAPRRSPNNASTPRVSPFEGTVGRVMHG
jgi:hypothetical protein